METENTLKLQDGRTLGYAEYGDASGTPVFYNHSGSRLDIRSSSPLAASLGVRIVAPDRPGIGLSDFRPGYQILDWPDDIAQVADHLELDSFAMFGHSSGGVFSLACAYKMSERVTRCAVVGGAAPMDVPGIMDSMNLFGRTLYTLGKRTTWHMKVQARVMARMMKGTSNETMARNMLKTMSGPDRDVFAAHPELLSDILDAGRECFRSGTEGAVWGNALNARPWGFAPEDIRVPVVIWHGEEDGNAPVVMAEYLAQAIPGSELHIMAKEGHGSILINHMETILTGLMASQTYDMQIEAG